MYEAFHDQTPWQNDLINEGWINKNTCPWKQFLAFNLLIDFIWPTMVLSLSSLLVLPLILKQLTQKKMLSPKEIAEANEDIEKDEDEVQEDKQEKKEK